MYMSDSYDAVLGMTYKTANEPRSKYLRGLVVSKFQKIQELPANFQNTII